MSMLLKRNALRTSYIQLEIKTWGKASYLFSTFSRTGQYKLLYVNRWKVKQQKAKKHIAVASKGNERDGRQATVYDVPAVITSRQQGSLDLKASFSFSAFSEFVLD